MKLALNGKAFSPRSSSSGSYAPALIRNPAGAATGIQIRLDQSLAGKSSAGMRFQVFFEFKRFLLVGKSAIPEQGPWCEFGSMDGFSGVVSGKPLFQIGSRAGVFLIGKIDAAENYRRTTSAFQPVVALRAMPGTASA
ncbi:hypothetical protein ATY29_04250 [Rhizobium hidalgonense]|nr:hypothetical protein ATY29_04250 [Rhizobium hidalgonense]